MSSLKEAITLYKTVTKANAVWFPGNQFQIMVAIYNNFQIKFEANFSPIVWKKKIKVQNSMYNLLHFVKTQLNPN